jgi:hypothetical protein
MEAEVCRCRPPWDFHVVTRVGERCGRRVLGVRGLGPEDVAHGFQSCVCVGQRSMSGSCAHGHSAPLLSWEGLVWVSVCEDSFVQGERSPLSYLCWVVSMLR